ncbi:MAG: autotransporter-associated beta strand repeat-containing protein, partial [Sedimentisphaerales bacterium]|nr:autotransporter-associated beta strand repeat-containing protein [Sedimentisphaerales bacterium]
MLSVTWNGQGGDNLWSTAANWVGGQVPGAGEDLIFSGSTRTSTENDLAYAFDSLTFTSGNFSISGNAVLLDGDLSVNAGVTGTSIPAGISFGDEADLNVGYGANMTIGGEISNTDSLTVNVLSGSSMSAAGGFSGAGELALLLGYGSSITVGGEIDGASDVTLDVPSGSSMTITGGLSDIGGLTATEGNGSSLAISGGISGEGNLTFTEGGGSSLTIEGDIAQDGLLSVTQGNGAMATISGDISEQTGITWNTGYGAAGTLSGDISGTGGLTKSGGGTLTLSGQNSFTGTTSITAGTLTLETSDALGGSTLDYTTSGGTLNIGNLTALELGGLSGDKNLVLTNGSSQAVALSVGGNSENTTYSGALSGAGSLTKTGSGTLTLTGSTGNTYAGDTTVTGGSLNLAKTSGYAVPGDVTFAGTAEGFVRLMEDGQIAPTADLAFTGSNWQIVLLLGHDLTVAGISGSTGFGVIENTWNETGDYDPVTLTVNNTENCSFNGLITNTWIGTASPVSLVKNGSGTLTLGGGFAASGFSGDLTVNDGNLVGVSPNAFGASDNTRTITVNEDATLTFATSGMFGYHTSTAAPTLVIDGGTVMSTGQNVVVTLNDVVLNDGTMTSTTDAGWWGAWGFNGTVTSTGDSAINYTAGNGIVALQGGDVAVSETVFDVESGTLSIAGTLYNGVNSQYQVLASNLTKTGSGTLVLGGAEGVHMGTTTIAAGTLRLESSYALGNSTLDYNVGDGTLDMDSLTAVNLGGLSGDKGLVLTNNSSQAIALSVGGNHQNTTYSGALSGAGSLTKTGYGTLTLAGSTGNTYAGDTTITLGKLDLAKTGGYAVPGDLTFAGTSQVFVSLLEDDQIAPTANLTFNSPYFQELKLLGHDLTVASLSDSTGMGIIENTWNETGTYDPVTVTVNNTENCSYNGQLKDTWIGTASPMSLVKSGAGTLTLGGGNYANGFSGDLTVNGGNLVGVSTNAFGTSDNTRTLTVNTGATLTFDTSDMFGHHWVTAVPTLNINGGTVLSTGENARMTLNDVILNNGTMSASTDCGGWGAWGINGVVTSNGDSTITYTDGNGQISLQAGDPAVPQTIFNVQSGTLTVTSPLVNGVSTDYQAVLDSQLLKTGSGTLILAGEGTFTGQTTISTGTLQLEASNALSGSTLDYDATGGTLDIDSLTALELGGLSGDKALALTNGSAQAVALSVGGNDEDTTYSGVLSGLGSLTTTGTGSLTLTGTNTYTGGTTIDGGRLQLGDGTTTGSIQGDVVNNGTLEFNPAVVLTYGGTISGTGDVAKSGTGSLALTGDNTYTGATIITGGSVYVGYGTDTGSLGTGTVANDGTLIFDTSDTQTACIVGSGTLTIGGTGDFILNTPGVPTFTINDTNDLLIPGGAVSVITPTVLTGMTMTLTVTVADPFGDCQGVEFYLDTNGDGQLDGGDESLGSGTNQDGYWSTTVSTLGWGPSAAAIFAEATFDPQSTDPPASTQAEAPLDVLAEWAIIGPGAQAGYAESGAGFSTVYSGEAYDGATRVMSGTDPDAYVTYTFTDLVPGNYEIWTNYIADAQYSDAVPIEVYDGDPATGLLKQEFTIDETKLHWSNWEVDGVDWNWSDNYFYSNSGTVTVRVACDGELTQAPAVRLILAPISKSPFAPCSIASNDPVDLPTGTIKYCGCGGELPEGAWYDNRHASIQSDTGNGMSDHSKAKMEGAGSLVEVSTDIDTSCPTVDTFLEPVRHYTPLYGSKATLEDVDTDQDGNGDYLLYTREDGTQFKFIYPDQEEFAIGQWFEMTTPGGEYSKVVLWADDSGNTSPGYFTGYFDKVAEVQYWAAGEEDPYRSEVYTYITNVGNPNFELRSSITYRNWDPEANEGEGDWVNEEQVTYDYYGTGSDNGLLHDLKTVTTKHWDPALNSGEGGWPSEGDTIYYRYYTEATYDPPESTEEEDYIGFAHGLKRQLLPEAYAKACEHFNTTNLDTVDDDDVVGGKTLADFTCFYYEYNTEQRVTLETVYGGLRTTTYDYDEEGYSLDTEDPDYNLWTCKTVETRDDGTTFTVYANFLGQQILTDLADTSGNHWYTYREYDEDSGTLVLDAAPSSIASYSESQTVDGQLDVIGTGTTPGTAGLVNKYTYYDEDTAGESTAGGVENYRESMGVAQGLDGSTVTTAEYEYFKHTYDGTSVYHAAEQTKYTETDETGDITTSYDVSWHTDSVQIEEEILELPLISTDQNGSNASDYTYTWHDAKGNLTWTMDQADRVNYYRYDEATGRLDYAIQDVDNEEAQSESLPVPTNWSLPSDGAHLRTDYEYDLTGRLVQTLGPEHTALDATGMARSVRTASWTLHDEANHQTFSANGYKWLDSSTSQWHYTLVNPVSIVKTNHDGDVTERIEAVAGTTTLDDDDPLSTIAAETFTQDEYTSWTTYQYSQKQMVSIRAYHDIPTSGEGASGTNYDQANKGYDALGRSEWIQTPDGTITWNVRDARGLVLSTWIGTDATGATHTDPSNGGTNDMVLVSANIYDYGADGGDGLLTESREYFNSGTDDYYATEYYYDWRDRLTDTRGPDNVVTHTEYDNIGRTLWTKTYADVDATPDYFTYTGDVITGTNPESNELRAQTQYLYDDLGRVYETHTYEIDPDDGSEGSYLPSYTWYDELGRTIKTADGNGLFQKNEYDNLGRLVTSYTCFDDGDDTYAEAKNTDDDTVIEQIHYYYDNAGQTVATATYERLPNDTSTTGALSAANSYTTAVVMWHDGAGRTVATANYGREDDGSGYDHYFFHDESGQDQGGSYAPGDLIDVERDGLPDRAQNDPPAPNSSDDYIVSLTQYDDAGRAYRTIDNLGRIDESQYDDLGRVVRSIQNYDDGDVDETDTDCDVTVDYRYDTAGQLVALVAHNAKGSNNGVEDQWTVYLYESSVNASWQTDAIYPDSVDGQDVTSLTRSGTTATATVSGGHSYSVDDWVYVVGAEQPEYNGLVQITAVDGNTFSYTIEGTPTNETGDFRVYDSDGTDRVTTDYDRLGRTISTTDQRGVVHTYSYDTVGRLSADKVDLTGVHAGQNVDDSILAIVTNYDDVSRVEAVTSYTTADEQYWDAGHTANQVEYEYNGWGRLAREYQEHDGTVDGNTLHIDYVYSDGAVNDVAKYVRLTQITYPNGRDVNYDYGTTGAIDDIMSHLAAIKDDDGSTVLASYKYLGAGRIVTEDYEGPDVRLDYNADDNLGGLDRFGRVVDQFWEDYDASATLDQYTYTYDRASNRTGKDNELHSAFDEDYTYDDLDRLASTDRADNFDQSWTLDGLGNWSEFDDDGTSQTREANEANEITAISGGSIVPTYDDAGNMISGPSPDYAPDRFHFVYDAWNRLVGVFGDDSGEPGTPIEQYEYDGAGRRTVKITTGEPGTIRHFYYND